MIWVNSINDFFNALLSCKVGTCVLREGSSLDCSELLEWMDRWEPDFKIRVQNCGDPVDQPFKVGSLSFPANSLALNPWP